MNKLVPGMSLLVCLILTGPAAAGCKLGIHWTIERPFMEHTQVRSPKRAGLVAPQESLPMRLSVTNSGEQDCELAAGWNELAEFLVVSGHQEVFGRKPPGVETTQDAIALLPPAASVAPADVIWVEPQTARYLHPGEAVVATFEIRLERDATVVLWLSPAAMRAIGYPPETVGRLSGGAFVNVRSLNEREMAHRLLRMAVHYRFAPDDSTALALLDSAAELVPTSAKILATRGRILDRRGDLQDAREAYIQALALHQGETVDPVMMDYGQRDQGDTMFGLQERVRAIEATEGRFPP